MDKVEIWTLHFRQMAEGKLKSNHKGKYVVEKIQMGGTIKEPAIKLELNRHLKVKRTIS